MGASGAYGHVVLRGVPQEELQEEPREEPAIRVPWLLLSAADEPSLRQVARRLARFLAKGLEVALGDLLFTLQVGREALTARLALPARSLEGVEQALEDWLSGGAPAGLRFRKTVPRTGKPGPRVDELPVDGPPPSPEEAVEAWLEGADIPWESLWGSPPGREDSDRRSRPPRRIPLPTYPFAGGKYWLGSEVLGEPRSQEPRSQEPLGQETRANRRRRLEERLKEIYSEVSGIAAEDLHTRVPLERYGLSSFLVGRLNSRLEEEFGTLSQTLFFEVPDLAGLARRLSREGAGGEEEACPPEKLEKGPPREGLPRVRGGQGGEDIAIVGLGGRYGEAPDLSTFWRNLVAAKDCVKPYPEDRLREGWPGELMWGSFLEGVDRFDPLFFKISPREAHLMGSPGAALPGGGLGDPGGRRLHPAAAASGARCPGRGLCRFHVQRVPLPGGGRGDGRIPPGLRLGPGGHCEPGFLFSRSAGA